MTATLEITALGQIARTVKDIKQSEEWYRSVLDDTEEWMAIFKDLEGRPLALMSQVK